MGKIVFIAFLTMQIVWGANFELSQVCDGAGNLNDSAEEIAKKFPVGDCDALSKSRGGNLNDVDAIKDGSGVITLAPIGQPKKTGIQYQKNGIFELIKKYPEAAKQAKENGEPLIKYVQDNDIADMSTEEIQEDLFGKKLEEASESASVKFGYFKISNMVWPVRFKMFALRLSVNGTVLNNGDANWNQQGAGPSNRPLTETLFQFYESKVEGTMASGYATITLNEPIEISQASDIKVEYLSGAFWFSNQRLSSVTLEMYSTDDQLISSRAYTNLDSGSMIGQNICYKSENSSSGCANIVAPLIANPNLQF